MASQWKTLKSWKDVALREENIYVFVPYFTIETAYVITSGRLRDGAYFRDLPAADREYRREIARHH